MAKSAESSRSRVTSVLALAFGLLAGGGVTALGQDGAAALATRALGVDLSRRLQGQARAALERHLHPEEFQVFVRATPIEAPVEPIPYLPETMAVVARADAPPEALAPFL